MKERLDYVSINGPALSKMMQAKDCMPSIDEKLRALIELRVSQINGCAYCVDLHTTEAKKAGENQQKLECLTVWQECDFYDDGEKSALAWAEAVTLISERRAPQALYEALCDQFSDAQVVDITLIIAQMNAWNRMAIGFGNTAQRRAE
ncbi:MAG: carboxymuconolactone decarboxylase family protein [Sneathiella sp.]